MDNSSTPKLPNFQTPLHTPDTDLSILAGRIRISRTARASRVCGGGAEERNRWKRTLIQIQPLESKMEMLPSVISVHRRNP